MTRFEIGFESLLSKAKPYLSKLLIFLFVVFANYWIWRIFAINILVALALILISFFLTFSTTIEIKLTKIALIILIVSLLLQVSTTHLTNLNTLTPLEKDLYLTRFNEYPPTYLNFANNKFHIPSARIIETLYPIPVQKILSNLSTLIDINFYFYGSNPRSHSQNYDFEKFSFIFLPFAFYGIYSFIKRQITITLMFFIVPVILGCLIGLNSDLGPIALFPFFVTAITLGVTRIIKFKHG